jgi:hypothetical protein
MVSGSISKQNATSHVTQDRRARPAPIARFRQLPHGCLRGVSRHAARMAAPKPKRLSGVSPHAAGMAAPKLMNIREAERW